MVRSGKKVCPSVTREGSTIVMATFAPVAGAAAAAAEEAAAPRRHPEAEGQDTTGGGADFEMGERQNAPAPGNRQSRRKRTEHMKKGVAEETMSDWYRPGTIQFGLKRSVTNGAGKVSRVPQSRLAGACRAYGKFFDVEGATSVQQDETLADHPLTKDTDIAARKRMLGALLDRQEATAHERDWAAVENWVLLCYPTSSIAATIRIWGEAAQCEPGSREGDNFPEGCVFRPLPMKMVQSMMEVYMGRRGEIVILLS